jgi:hypothetical protein
MAISNASIHNQVADRRAEVNGEENMMPNRGWQNIASLRHGCFVREGTKCLILLVSEVGG